MHSAVDNPDQLDRLEDEHYDLYGVCVHSGYSTNSGHYFSYCKGEDQRWYECNDSLIGQASENEALSQEAYLLFYQKRLSKENRSLSQASTNNSTPIETPTIIEAN